MSASADEIHVSVVTVTHNSEDDVGELLDHLEHPHVEVIVVDNASADRSADIAAQRTDCVRLPINVGWARGCNIGAGRARGGVIAFVNPDARPKADTLLALADRLDAAEVAAVSPRFVHPDGTPQPFYFRFPTVVSGLFCFLGAGHRIDQLLGSPFIRRRTYDFGTYVDGEVDQPGAACLLVRADRFRALGGFDDDEFLFFADTDLCRRLRATGARVEVAWDIEVEHLGGASVRQLSDFELRRCFQRDYLTYVRRHHGRIGLAVTRAGVVLLTGLVPAITRLLRGRPRDAAEQLWLAARVLR